MTSLPSFLHRADPLVCRVNLAADEPLVYDSRLVWCFFASVRPTAANKSVRQGLSSGAAGVATRQGLHEPAQPLGRPGRATVHAGKRLVTPFRTISDHPPHSGARTCSLLDTRPQGSASRSSIPWSRLASRTTMTRSRICPTSYVEFRSHQPG